MTKEQKTNKRKRSNKGIVGIVDFLSENPHKPSASVLSHSKPRSHTISIAIPASILGNVQTAELRTYVVGEIARTLAIFNVDEIIIFNDSSNHDEKSNYLDFMIRLLTYIETPQYLRKLLFPVHKDLKLAGILNPLDCPHHLRITDNFRYREGVIIQNNSVSVGLEYPINLNTNGLNLNTRVTVDMNEKKLISSSIPRELLGVYWGYKVRKASSLSKILTECQFKNGYDFVIGTSERGEPLNEHIQNIPQFKHLLIILGGLSGLEVVIDSDQDIQITGDRSKELFDAWIDIMDGNQGSRTIRTEEALIITLSRLKDVLINGGSIKNKD